MNNSDDSVGSDVEKLLHDLEKKLQKVVRKQSGAQTSDEDDFSGNKLSQSQMKKKRITEGASFKFYSY